MTQTAMQTREREVRRNTEKRKPESLLYEELGKYFKCSGDRAVWLPSEKMFQVEGERVTVVVENSFLGDYISTRFKEKIVHEAEALGICNPIVQININPKLYRSLVPFTAQEIYERLGREIPTVADCIGSSDAIAIKRDGEKIKGLHIIGNGFFYENIKPKISGIVGKLFEEIGGVSVKTSSICAGAFDVAKKHRYLQIEQTKITEAKAADPNLRYTASRSERSPLSEEKRKNMGIPYPRNQDGFHILPSNEGVVRELRGIERKILKQNPGNPLCYIGASGCGKTALLSLLMNSLADSGVNSIYLNTDVFSGIMSGCFDRRQNTWQEPDLGSFRRSAGAFVLDDTQAVWGPSGSLREGVVSRLPELLNCALGHNAQVLYAFSGSMAEWEEFIHKLDSAQMRNPQNRKNKELATRLERATLVQVSPLLQSEIPQLTREMLGKRLLGFPYSSDLEGVSALVEEKLRTVARPTLHIWESGKLCN